MPLRATGMKMFSTYTGGYRGGSNRRGVEGGRAAPFLYLVLGVLFISIFLSFLS